MATYNNIPAGVDVRATRGDMIYFAIQRRNADDSIYNFATNRIIAQAKLNKTDESSIFTFDTLNGTIVNNGTNIEIIYHSPAAESIPVGIYYFDIQEIKANGDRKTHAYGTFSIAQDVTRLQDALNSMGFGFFPIIFA